MVEVTRWKKRTLNVFYNGFIFFWRKSAKSKKIRKGFSRKKGFKVYMLARKRLYTKKREYLRIRKKHLRIVKKNRKHLLKRKYAQIIKSKRATRLKKRKYYNLKFHRNCAYKKYAHAIGYFSLFRNKYLHNSRFWDQFYFSRHFGQRKSRIRFPRLNFGQGKYVIKRAYSKYSRKKYYKYYQRRSFTNIQLYEANVALTKNFEKNWMSGKTRRISGRSFKRSRVIRKALYAITVKNNISLKAKILAKINAFYTLFHYKKRLRRLFRKSKRFTKKPIILQKYSRFKRRKLKYNKGRLYRNKSYTSRKLYKKQKKPLSRNRYKISLHKIQLLRQRRKKMFLINFSKKKTVQTIGGIFFKHGIKK